MSYLDMREFAFLQRELHCFHVYDRREERKRKILEAKKSFSEKSCSLFKWISKKAVFITSVPFYWFIIFRYFLGSFDAGLFIFIIAASFIMSFFGSGWGLLNGLVR